MNQLFNKLNPSGNRIETLQRLLLVNVLLFLLIRITFAVSSLFNHPLLSFDDVSYWLAVPSNIGSLMHRPWTLVTYMFYHWDFFHLLFNMLWLYWMGSIMVEYLGSKKLFGVYILGGLFGALAYLISFNLFPYFHETVYRSYALGASASILAITVATATLLPNYTIALLFLGNIPLKWIAIVSVLLDLISVTGDNAGGHIAHLGGALFGFLYIRLLQNGTNLTSWIEKVNWSGNRSASSMKVAHRGQNNDENFNMSKKAVQEKMDEILDKINKSGYGSLSQVEKDFLFKMSKDDK